MEDKRIMIVGVLDTPHSSNIWLSTSFMKYGYQVLPVNYRTVIATKGPAFFKNYLLNAVARYSPSLVIFCKCNGIDPAIVAEVSKMTKTYLFFMDLYVIAEQSPEIIEHARNSHFSSCTSEITVDFFKKQGVENCFHVFEGANPNIHKPVDAVDKYKADVSFITNIMTTEKRQYYNTLKENGYDVRFYTDKLTNGEWSQINSSSKYMLSISTFNNVPTYFSGRLFETLACGVCTFQVDSTGTLGKYFKDMEEVIFFKNQTDLIAKMKSLSEEDRIKIAINGREKILRSYTWHHTAQNILHIAGI